MMSAVKYLIQMLMDKIMQLEVASYNLFLFQKGFFYQLWQLRNHAQKLTFSGCSRKSSGVLMHLFSDSSCSSEDFDLQEMPAKKTSFMMAFLSLPDSGAVLIY